MVTWLFSLKFNFYEKYNVYYISLVNGFKNIEYIQSSVGGGHFLRTPTSRTIPLRPGRPGINGLINSIVFGYVVFYINPIVVFFIALFLCLFMRKQLNSIHTRTNIMNNVDDKNSLQIPALVWNICIKHEADRFLQLNIELCL